MRYSHWTPFDQIPATVGHVRAHLSSIATAGDNPTTYTDDVAIDLREQDGGMLVIGQLDQPPMADYLMPGWYPDQDVAANPLTVPSIEYGS